MAKKKTDSVPEETSEQKAALAEEPRPVEDQVMTSPEVPIDGNAPPDAEWSEEAAGSNEAAPPAETENAAEPRPAPKRRATENRRNSLDEAEVEKGRATDAAREFALRESRSGANSDRISAREQHANDIGRLRTALSKHYVLEGDVISSQRLAGHLYFVVAYGVETVLIRFDQFMLKSPINYISRYHDDGTETTKALIAEEALRKRELFAQKMFGAHVEFIVTHLEKVQGSDRYLILGSRSAALISRRKRFFDKDATGAAAIHVGDDITAEVIAVGDHNMRISAYGMDIQLPKTDVSNRYIMSLASYYFPGDQIKVRVRHIRYDGKTCEEVMVSAAVLEMEALRKNLSRVRVGQRCIATVTSIRLSETGYPKYFLFLEYLNVIGRANRIVAQSTETELHSGDRVLVSIDEIGEDWVTCVINRISPKRLCL